MRDKVLLVSCTGLGTGGVQNVIMQIVRNLSYKYLFDVVVFTEEIGAYENEFLSFGGKIFRISDFPDGYFIHKIGFYFRGLKIEHELKQIINNNGPYHAIHCNNYYEGAFCLKAAKKAGIKVRISHAHGYYGDMETFARKYYLSYCRKVIKTNATNRICCSPSAGRLLFGDDSASVIPNAVDLQRFNLRLREKYRINEEPRFIQVGYFSDNKNQLFTIQVFSCFLKAFPNSTLWLVGFGDYKHRLEEEVASLGITSRVSFLPGTSDIPNCLAQSDIFMFPSLHEGFGIAAVEAQIMGLHAFASLNVTKEIDIGACDFLDLDDGKEEWTKTIYNWWINKKVVQTIDFKKYDLRNIIRTYDEIYSV